MEAAAAGLDPGQTRPADPATSENEDGAIKKTFDWVGSDEPRRFLIINQGSEKGPLSACQVSVVLNGLADVRATR